jgi:hypothetical protein
MEIAGVCRDHQIDVAVRKTRDPELLPVTLNVSIGPGVPGKNDAPVFERAKTSTQ